MNNTLDRTKALEERLIQFSVSVVLFAQNAGVHDALKNQVIRSCTSIGANYAEAINASSKVDFRNKIYIAKKEAAETKYWLKLIPRLDKTVVNEDILNECQSILMILQKIINTLNEKRKTNEKSERINEK